MAPIWQPFMGGVAYEYFLGTADYSVGDPTATHVRGLGLGPKYSLFMSYSTIGHGVADFIQKNVFFRGQKGCFWHIFAHFRPLPPILVQKQHFQAKNTLFDP